MPIGSGLGGGQFLHQPHHVVAEIAEYPAAIGGKLSGSAIRLSAISARNACSGGSGQGANASASARAERLIFGLAAVCAPDQVRLEPDDGITAAHGAAFD